MSEPSQTIQAEAERLEPCPWCGGEVMPRWALWISDGCIDSIIHAEPSDCPMQVFEDGSTDRSIVAKWNFRPAVASALQALTDEIDELRGELAKNGVTLAAVSRDGTYDTPEHGWTCFHCGCHFAGTHSGWQAAGYHFGWTPDMQPACRIAEEEGGLSRRLRAYEDGARRDEKAIASLSAQIDARDERIKVLEAALKPFVKIADERPDMRLDAFMSVPMIICRNARTALKPVPASTGEQKDSAE